jgi:hypothetical protein
VPEPIGERTHDARAPSDLAQDAFERIVGPNTSRHLANSRQLGGHAFDLRFVELVVMLTLNFDDIEFSGY